MPLVQQTIWLRMNVALTLICVLFGCGGETIPTQSVPQENAAATQPTAVDAKNSSAPGPSSPEVPVSNTPPSTQPQPINTGAAEKQQPKRSRLPDDRPELNAERLRAIGIQRIASKRLVLLTDLPLESVSKLPMLADRLYESLVDHFGELLPTADRSEFQVTGHLIGDEKRFRSAGLMPAQGFTFKHGRHNKYQFWIYNPNPVLEYYRRHLLFHEFTHCFMTCESGMSNIPPLWYIEGMAEYFGTHRISEDGTIEFGVLPEQFDGFDGWGRISELRRSFTQRASVDAEPEQQAIPPLAEVMPDVVANFSRDSQYATSWALCWMLNNHPDYRRQFSPLSGLRTRKEFIDKTARIRADLQPRLSVDWLLLHETLREGFDPERSWPVHSATTFTASQLSGQTTKQMQLKADHDWQDTGLRLNTGESVHIECTGEFAVNDDPAPWKSEPQGVTIEYVRGLPLGKVVACLVADNGSTVTNRIPVGRGTVVRARGNGSLWLQVNDTSNSRADNSGSVSVTLSVP